MNVFKDEAGIRLLRDDGRSTIDDVHLGVWAEPDGWLVRETSWSFLWLAAWIPLSNDECRVSNGRTGRSVVEGDVLVFPLVEASGQILSRCRDMSTAIIAAVGMVVKCLCENSWDLFGGVRGTCRKLIKGYECGKSGLSL